MSALRRIAGWSDRRRCGGHVGLVSVVSDDEPGVLGCGVFRSTGGERHAMGTAAGRHGGRASAWRVGSAAGPSIANLQHVEQRMREPEPERPLGSLSPSQLLTADRSTCHLRSRTTTTCHPRSNLLCAASPATVTTSGSVARARITRTVGFGSWSAIDNRPP